MEKPTRHSHLVAPGGPARWNRACLALAILMLTACAPDVREDRDPSLPPPAVPLEEPPPPDFPPEPTQPEPVAPVPEPVPAQPAPPPKPKLKPKPSIIDYRVDTDRSELTILVYRSGKLEHLGHNHIIASRSIEGSARLAAPLTDSRVKIRVPTGSLIVDHPAMRKSAGGDFKSELPEADIKNVKSALFGEKMLDVARYPEIVVNARVVGGSLPEIELEIALEIRGQQKTLRAPARLEKTGKLLTTTGEFSLSLSELGMQPPSLLMGALTVQDKVRVRYRILALENP